MGDHGQTVRISKFRSLSRQGRIKQIELILDGTPGKYVATTAESTALRTEGTTPKEADSFLMDVLKTSSLWATL